MKFARSFVCLTIALCPLLVSETSDAQTNSGFALNRYEPSERGSDWFASDSFDIRGHGRFAAGLVLDYAYRPLVIFDASDTEDQRATIVAHQLYSHLGGAVILWERVRFGLNVPIALFMSGDGGRAAGGTLFSDPQHSTTIGDLRLAADVRIIGNYGDPATFGGGLWIFLPTGEQDSYTSDGALRSMPRLSLAGDVSGFTYAAQAGIAFRARNENFAGVAMGSEMTWSLAAGAHLVDKRLTVGPELYGSTVITDKDSFFGEKTSPVELVIGGHYATPDGFRFGAGMGPGLTRAFGTPSLRVLATVEYLTPVEKPKPPPPPEPKDRDGDGIIDPEDACPDEPGVRTDDPKTNGCPAPKDRDGDGIIDPEDACPDEPGPKSEDPKKNGCPLPPDCDGDGIIDDEDACPDEPGERNDDPKKNGCPPPKDRDGDGILDPEDVCPDVPGERNDDPKKNGCPVARIEKGKIIIREQVQFAYNSDKILKTSDYILEAVQKLLLDHPEIKKVSVEGHTDSKGSDAYNKGLSKRRAASVMNWLAQKGQVSKKRLESKGWGEEKPIDTNDTEDGRANNRRVEFMILEMDESAASSTTTTPPAAPPPKKQEKPAPKAEEKPAPKKEEKPAAKAEEKPKKPADAKPGAPAAERKPAPKKPAAAPK